MQTPTLAMLVERERAITAFVPEKYCEVLAHFDTYKGTSPRLDETFVASS